MTVEGRNLRSPVVRAAAGEVTDTWLWLREGVAGGCRDRSLKVVVKNQARVLKVEFSKLSTAAP